MSSLHQNPLDGRQQAVELGEREQDSRVADLTVLANELSAERERLRALRAELLERLDGQSDQVVRQRASTEPRPDANPLNEHDWWARVLGGRKTRTAHDA